MDNDKEHFTNAMRHAKSSQAVTGGSTAVRGKPVEAKGFMVTQDDDKTPTAGEEQTPVTIPTAETLSGAPRTSFFDEEYRQGRRVTVQPTTASFVQPTTASFFTARKPTDNHMDHVRTRIAHALRQRDYVPDFRACDIPSSHSDAAGHARLHDLMSKRKHN